MKIKIILIIFGILLIGFIFGAYSFAKSEIKLMQEYDLYNCIYNNAESNGFTNNQYLIKEIQDECICFRKYNYTNLSGVDC